MAEIRVKCECGKGLRLSAEQAGRTGRCPQCGRSVTVPTPEAFERLAGRGHTSIGDLETLAAGKDIERDTRNDVSSVGERKTQSTGKRASRPRTGLVEAPSCGEAAGLWQPGKVIDDRYEVKEELGSGQFGRVWKVWHNQWQIDLAVKELRTEKNLTENRRRDFLREAQAWVDDIGMHPHVVTAWYVRELEGQHYLFLEYCDGGSLHDWIEQGTTRDLKTALDIGIQLCWGLAHCHEKGIVHRDFKPLNVLMTADGTAKLTDFGTVRFAGMAGAEDDGSEAENVDDIRRTRGGRLQGTPAYMPPEQWTKGSDIDHRADVYALGVTLFEMLTGEFPIRPSDGRSISQWACAHAQKKPRSLIEHHSEVPATLSDLIAQCLIKQAEGRPESCLAVVERLQKICRETVGDDRVREMPEEVQPLADQLNNKALSFLDLGRQKQAEATWEQALSADPCHLESIYNQGVYLWRAARLDHATLVRRLRDVKTAASGWRAAYLAAQVHVERLNEKAAVWLLDPLADAERKRVDVASLLAYARKHDVAASLGGYCLRTFGAGRGIADLHRNSVALSADGRHAFSIDYGRYSTHADTLRMWEVTTGELVREFRGHKMHVTSVALSADGRYVLSGSADRTLNLWEVATGRCLRTLEGHTAPVYAVALSTDGGYALSGGHDTTLKLWVIQTGRCLRTLEGHAAPVYAVAFSNDGRYALSAGDEKTLKLWDLETGSCRRTFEGHGASVGTVGLSVDGRYAVSGSSDKSLKLWDLTSGHCLRTIEGSDGAVTSLVLSANGRFILSASANRLKLWEVETGRCLRTLEDHKTDVTSVALSADGRYALSAESRYGQLKLWDFSLLSSVRRASWELSRLIESAEAVSAQSQFRESIEVSRRALARGELSQAAKALRGARALPGRQRDAQALEIWGRLCGLLPKRAFVGGWDERTLPGHTSYVTAVTLSADGCYALSGSEDKTLKLWEACSGRCLRTFEGHDDTITSLALSADGRCVLSGGYKSIKFWNTTSGRCLRTFRSAAHDVRAVALRADGLYALSGSGDNGLMLWHVSSGRCLRTFRGFLKGHRASVNTVVLSADGRSALSGSADKRLKLWDIASGRCLHTYGGFFKGHRESVNALALSADDRYVLSGSADWTLKLWEVTSGRCLHTFEGHTDRVTSVALSGDARYALSGSADNTLKLWELAGGSCLYTFKGQHISSVALSLDGRYALSGNSDNTLKLWTLDWELEDREPADWDDRARPYLETFLTLHTPFASQLPKDREPTEEEIRLALTRSGQARITETGIQQLIRTLQHAGYGWLRPEGVKKKLLEMAAGWTGPPPLPFDDGGDV